MANLIKRIAVSASRRNNDASIATLHLLSHLYVTRSYSLWKIPETTTWLKQTISTLLSTHSSLDTFFIPSNRHNRFLKLVDIPASNLSHSIYRHTLIVSSSNTAYRRLAGYIPPEVQMTRWFAFDPLPPPGAVSVYDQAYFEGVDTSAVGGIGTGGWEDGFDDEDGVLRDPGLM